MSLEISTDTDDPLSYSVLALSATGTWSVFYTVSFFLFLYLLFLSALFSGAETLLPLLTNEEKETYQKSSRSIAQLIRQFSAKPKHSLASLLLADSLVNIALAALSIYVIWYAWQSYAIRGVFALSGILFLGFIIVFFGEVLPKLYARRNPRFFLRQATFPILVASYVLTPFSWILLRITQYIEQYLHKRGYKISVDELTQVLESSVSANTSESEKQFLQGVVNFGTIIARQIMRPRLDVVAFPLELDFHELMDKINKSGYSRVPIYEETIDEIAGILYIKDLLPHLDKDEDFDWHTFLRTPYFITENKKIDALLYDFQVRRVHMAIVVDEYGGTSGLVTLEDIIEEIIGDIRDEFDEEEKSFTQIDEHTYVFEGKILLNDLCRILEIDADVFEDVRGDSESLGGLLLELFTRLPQTGEKTHYKNWTFSILSADSKKIKRVKVTIEASPKSSPTERVSK
jgi:gliding motility-associated protein GldE